MLTVDMLNFERLKVNYFMKEKKRIKFLFFTVLFFQKNK